jgi:hypothetical protein
MRNTNINTKEYRTLYKIKTFNKIAQETSETSEEFAMTEEADYDAIILKVTK